MKRVVTGVNAAGRSYVVSCEAIPSGGFTTIWEIDRKQVAGWIAAVDPERAARSIEPSPGGSRCVLAHMPPDSETPAQPRPQIPGIEPDGFHTTRTVDYDFVIEGPLVLLLDEGSVELETGDVVVQQATRHAWRNPGKRPAKLLAVITSVPN
jgi:mannose-6-phosphate isomerase-like protein (cupin superfamily)